VGFKILLAPGYGLSSKKKKKILNYLDFA